MLHDVAVVFQRLDPAGDIFLIIGNRMKLLGLAFVGVSVFGWLGFWFAGSGHAALIALGFLIAGLALLRAK
jgi:hypothetical protein